MATEKPKANRNSVVSFRTKEEEATVGSAIDKFSFGEQEPVEGKLQSLEAPPLLILLAGEENSGKTHFACTMSETGPVYLIDTELRAQHVIRKFRAQGKQVFHTTAFNYLDMFAAVKGIINKYPQGTVVFDSGSDLQKFAEQRVMDELDLDKIYPIPVWGYVWRKCNAPFDALKRAGFDVVVTARMKDEWVGDRSTGKQTPRIYSELPYKSDLVVICNRDKQKSIGPPHGKNGFGLTSEYKFTLETTLPTLITDLKGLP